jgi:glycosyltransferase involved in cell wall biosynthesis
MVILACSKCIAATQFIKDQVVKEFNIRQDKIVVIPHGHYVGVYEQKGKDYREAYGIPEDGYVFLFVGAIKPYKGIDKLIEAFNKIKNESTYLVIAGKPSKDVEEYLNAVQDRSNIIFDLRFIPDDEVGDIITCCDSFVLPFKEITTSGSAILALSFKKPVVMPKTPFVDEYFSPEIASIYDASRGELLESAMLQVQKIEQEKVDHVFNLLLAKLDWQRIAHQTSGVYMNKPAIQSLKGVG